MSSQPKFRGMQPIYNKEQKTKQTKKNNLCRDDRKTTCDTTSKIEDGSDSAAVIKRKSGCVSHYIPVYVPVATTWVEYSLVLYLIKVVHFTHDTMLTDFRFQTMRPSLRT